MSNQKIYVGNLSFDVGSEDLEQYFGQYGNIKEAKLIMDRETNRSKGFAFITYQDGSGAENALQANDQEWMGRKLRVNFARDDGGRGGNRRNHQRPFNANRGNHEREPY